MPPIIWFIGDFHTAEFAYAIAGLEPRVRRLEFACLGQAIDRARSASDGPCDSAIVPPEIIVIAQSRPGEVSAAEVEQLHAALPLARLVMLLGAWCEGEMRTGYPIAGVTRMFWHAFPHQVAGLLGQLHGVHAAAWAFPRIAGQQERLLREIPFRHGGNSPKRGGTLLVRAENLAAFEILAESFRAENHHCLWLDTAQWARYRACDCIIWDAPRLDSREWQLLATCREKLDSAPIVLLAGFPRWQELEMAKALGVLGVLAKPYRVSDLYEMVTPAILQVETAYEPQKSAAG